MGVLKKFVQIKFVRSFSDPIKAEKEHTIVGVGQIGLLEF